MDIAPLLTWIREPVALENVVKGLERCLEQLQHTQVEPLKARLLREAREILAQYQGRLTANECVRIAQLLAGHSEAYAALATYLVPSGATLALGSDEVPGKANALFVVNSAESFGGLHALKATALRG